jgi:hypothetical protein
MSKFRNSTNVRYTKQLFVEFDRTEDKSLAMYSLSRVDKTSRGKKFPSIYKLFMRMNDPLEHEFANKYFEDYYHWQDICNSHWMKPLIKTWREELELRIQSDALKAIQAEALTNSKYAYGANVYLAKKGWKEKEAPKVEASKNGRGRPSKSQILEEAQKIAMADHSALEDLERLGIKPV